MYAIIEQHVIIIHWRTIVTTRRWLGVNCCNFVCNKNDVTAFFHSVIDILSRTVLYIGIGNVSLIQTEVNPTGSNT